MNWVALVLFSLCFYSVESKYKVGANCPSAMTMRPSILDEYDVKDLEYNKLGANDPYYNESTLVFNHSLDHLLPVYDLNLNKVKLIETIYVECFEAGACETDISEKEWNYLSLYASMVEICGKQDISEKYSIGLIRQLANENLMGRFTKTFAPNGTTLEMTFWIRLTTGRHKQNYIYDHLSGYALTFGILELAIHERAHHDVALYDPSEGHCDQYQSWYNTLIHENIHDIDKYKALTEFIMGDRYLPQPDLYIGISVACVLVCIFISMCIVLRRSQDNFSARREKRVTYSQLP